MMPFCLRAQLPRGANDVQDRAWEIDMNLDYRMFDPHNSHTRTNE